MQKLIPVASLQSLRWNGYLDFPVRTYAESEPHFGPRPPRQGAVHVNIGEVFAHVDGV